MFILRETKDQILNQRIFEYISDEKEILAEFNNTVPVVYNNISELEEHGKYCEIHLIHYKNTGKRFFIENIIIQKINNNSYSNSYLIIDGTDLTNEEFYNIKNILNNLSSMKRMLSSFINSKTLKRHVDNDITNKYNQTNDKKHIYDLIVLNNDYFTNKIFYEIHVNSLDPKLSIIQNWGNVLFCANNQKLYEIVSDPNYQSEIVKKEQLKEEKKQLKKEKEKEESKLFTFVELKEIANIIYNATLQRKLENILNLIEKHNLDKTEIEIKIYKEQQIISLIDVLETFESFTKLDDNQIKKLNKIMKEHHEYYYRQFTFPYRKNKILEKMDNINTYIQNFSNKKKDKLNTLELQLTKLKEKPNVTKYEIDEINFSIKDFKNQIIDKQFTEEEIRKLKLIFLNL